MDNKALELQSAEVQTRAAVALATKEHNLATVSPSAENHYSWEGMGLVTKGCQFKSQDRSWAFGAPEGIQSPLLPGCNNVLPTVTDLYVFTTGM